jgi:hypothetical protein
VMLLPELRVNREDLFWVALSDENGHFVIRGVSPGGYRLRAYPGATRVLVTKPLPQIQPIPQKSI